MILKLVQAIRGKCLGGATASDTDDSGDAFLVKVLQHLDNFAKIREEKEKKKTWKGKKRGETEKEREKETERDRQREREERGERREEERRDKEYD